MQIQPGQKVVYKCQPVYFMTLSVLRCELLNSTSSCGTMLLCFDRRRTGSTGQQMLNDTGTVSQALSVL